MSSEFMFDGEEYASATESAPVPDGHKVKRQQILLSLRALVFANNAGAFTREQQLVSMAISIEQTIQALEAELGEPDEEAIGEVASQMTLLALRTG